MYKTKLTIAALAALSSVSVYAADSDFNASVKALFLFPMGDATKKQFKASDNLPYHFLPKSGYSIVESQAAATYPLILLGGHVGYSVTDSMGVRVGTYWGVKGTNYSVTYKKTGAAAVTAGGAAAGDPIADKETRKATAAQEAQYVAGFAGPMDSRAEHARQVMENYFTFTEGERAIPAAALAEGIGAIPGVAPHAEVFTGIGNWANASLSRRKQHLVNAVSDWLSGAAAPAGAAAIAPIAGRPIPAPLSQEHASIVEEILTEKLSNELFKGTQKEVYDRVKSKVSEIIRSGAMELSPDEKERIESRKKALKKGMGAVAGAEEAAVAAAEEIVNTISLSYHIPVMVGFDFKFYETDNFFLGANAGVGLGMWRASWSSSKAPSEGKEWKTTGESDRSFSAAVLASLEGGFNLGDTAKLVGSVGYGYFGEPDVKWGVYKSKDKADMTADQEFKLGSAVHGLVLSAGVAFEF